jgi:hypothetical protein
MQKRKPSDATPHSQWNPTSTILENLIEPGSACEEATTPNLMGRARRSIRDRKITSPPVLLPVAQDTIDSPNPMSEGLTRTAIPVFYSVTRISVTTSLKDRDTTPRKRHRQCLREAYIPGYSASQNGSSCEKTKVGL